MDIRIVGDINAKPVIMTIYPGAYLHPFYMHLNNGDFVNIGGNRYQISYKEYFDSHIEILVTKEVVNMAELRTSAQWMKDAEFVGTVIMDPDGWSRRNYQYYFYVELITREEMRSRIAKSTIKINNI